MRDAMAAWNFPRKQSANERQVLSTRQPKLYFAEAIVVDGGSAQI